jgi:Ca2+-binding EF-hand superfamily protein
MISEPDTGEEIYKSFFLFDNNRDGSIDIMDLKYVADWIGEMMSQEELVEMIKEADQNRDGLVSENDFKRVVRRASLFCNEISFHGSSNLLHEFP